MRIFEEFVNQRKIGDRHFDITEKLKRQTYIRKNDRHYDRLIYNVSAVHEPIWHYNKKRLMAFKLASYIRPTATLDEYNINPKRVNVTVTIWFDITIFLAQSNKEDSHHCT